MKHCRFYLFFLVCSLSLPLLAQKVNNDPAAPAAALLDRIGGKGTSNRLLTELDTHLGLQGETFLITAKNGKPCVKGSNLSALTTGINWYLNHYAHVNLSWNHLTTDLGGVKFPLPQKDEVHQSDAIYRYYLNYCTFGYSMTPWTWERWQQEIDWMALHGINMPLQIVGLEKVWKDFLMQDCGYSETDAEAFVPGPAFTAWWGMNNLEGWGGDGEDATKGVTNDAWYDRQAALAKKIVDRERELGMQPVLPGFSGMAPSNFKEKSGYDTEAAGGWCGFVRPVIIDPTSKDFATLAAKYYHHLEQVMGRSRYYSMDPFHEGGTITSGNYKGGYKAIYEAMNANAGSESQWVIQQWQWSRHQATSLKAVPEGRLVVLDLFSDGNPQFGHFGGYEPQDAIYCTIPNFGGRTGFFGRLPKMADNYFRYREKYATIKGIGAAPEAIEQTPIVYDLLFELPWIGHEPETKDWVSDYVRARYGVDNALLDSAWQTLRQTALNNTTTLQGPHEAVLCARPSLTVHTVSTWGGTDIFYKKELQQVIAAVRQMMDAAPAIIKAPYAQQNYSYDLCDLTRQALTDYAYYLLGGIRGVSHNGLALTNETYQLRKDAFLGLILDVDKLLGTNRMFRLGNWTETARKAATEVEGWTKATQDWYEYANARTLITTWGDEKPSERGGLRDYSYREWEGMLRDFYYPRWDYFFNHRKGELSVPEKGWFFTEWNWAHELSDSIGTVAKGTPKKKATIYTADPTGSTAKVADQLFKKYFLPVVRNNGQTHYAFRVLSNDLTAQITLPVRRGQRLDVSRLNIPGGRATIGISLYHHRHLTKDEEFTKTSNIIIPKDARTGRTKAYLRLEDGTEVKFTVDITE